MSSPAAPRASQRAQRPTKSGREASRHFAVLWLSLAALISFLLHLPLIGLPMISDEGGYAYTAQRWMDGRGTLYDDIWISRPQGIFVAYAAIFRTIGSDAYALRLGAFVAVMLTMLLVWRYAMAWAGGKVAAIAVVIFAVLSGSPAIEGFTANAEVFMALPAAACAVVLLYSSRNGWPWWTLLAVGALAAVATLLKPSAITILPMGLAYIWLAAQQPRLLLVRRMAWLGAGFAAGVAPALIHGYMVGWDNFAFAAITYRLHHQSSAANGLYRQVAGILIMLQRAWPVLLLPVVPIAFHWWAHGQRINVTAWTGRLSEARVGIVASPRRNLTVRRLGDAELLLRLWLLACLAGVVMGGDWWVHYLVQIVAPLSIWLAMQLLRVYRISSMPRQVAMIVVVGVMALLPYRVVALDDDAAVSKAIFQHSGYADQEAVAAYLRSKTPPETPIFAAFNEAALYYLADRPSTYRYLFDQELVAFPDTESRLIAMIESDHAPRYVIGTKQGAPFADHGRAFWAAVAANYHLEAIVHGVPIFRADSRIPRQLLLE